MSEIVPYILMPIVLISFLTFSLSMAYSGSLKNEILEAFYSYKNGQSIKFNKSDLGMLSPLAAFYILLSIPDINDNKEFYSIKIVEEKYFQMKSGIKTMKIGFIALFISITTLSTIMFLLMEK